MAFSFWEYPFDKKNIFPQHGKPIYALVWETLFDDIQKMF